MWEIIRNNFVRFHSIHGPGHTGFFFTQVPNLTIPSAWVPFLTPLPGNEELLCSPKELHAGRLQSNHTSQAVKQFKVVRLSAKYMITLVQTQVRDRSSVPWAQRRRHGGGTRGALDPGPRHHLTLTQYVTSSRFFTADTYKTCYTLHTFR
jgi:hypothetical protein